MGLSCKWGNFTGRNKDVPNMPKFPKGKRLDVFHRSAIHSLQYTALDDDAAEQLVKGKKVVVVGLGKSGLDIARGCAEINGPQHPCTNGNPYDSSCLQSLCCACMFVVDIGDEVLLIKSFIDHPNEYATAYIPLSIRWAGDESKGYESTVVA
ncbi:dimethylaniline monooxygenase, N-oxide-forming [Artemisia annua]|uniref:Dimethylaniline monooxygenase, N-oxide-forming n=1 Tax=Artemisia annua TaxID=35608 RepID=A0A2U1PGH9_ARTAN|nr:dimethylaniline monooxygenase, N-oxide-forming [Artemisia annua]